MGKIIGYPLRSIGAALTVAGAAVVFVVLVLPSLAAGGIPGGKYKVTGYENQKGGKTHKLYVGSWFYLTGTQFNSAFDVLCWESNDTSNGWTSVSSFTVVTSKLMQVDLADDCAGRGPATVRARSPSSGIWPARPATRQTTSSWSARPVLRSTRTHRHPGRIRDRGRLASINLNRGRLVRPNCT